MTELVLCIGNDRHLKTETRPAIAMLRNFCGAENSSSKSSLTKGKNRRAKHIRKQAAAGGDRPAYCYSKGEGIEPLPLARTRTTRLRATIRDLFYYLVPS
jgi:hypothetical protein